MLVRMLQKDWCQIGSRSFSLARHSAGCSPVHDHCIWSLREIAVYIVDFSAFLHSSARRIAANDWLLPFDSTGRFSMDTLSRSKAESCLKFACISRTHIHWILFNNLFSMSWIFDGYSVNGIQCRFSAVSVLYNVGIHWQGISCYADPLHLLADSSPTNLDCNRCSSNMDELWTGKNCRTFLLTIFYCRTDWCHGERGRALTG